MTIRHKAERLRMIARLAHRERERESAGWGSGLEHSSASIRPRRLAKCAQSHTSRLGWFGCELDVSRTKVLRYAFMLAAQVLGPAQVAQVFRPAQAHGEARPTADG